MIPPSVTDHRAVQTAGKAMKHLAPWLKVAVYILAVPVLILLVRAFDARQMPDLHPWHRVQLANEFRSAHAADHFTFDDYLQLENDLFTELDQVIYQAVSPEKHRSFNRYHTGSKCDPRKYDQNWNRSFQLIPENAKGGVLLLHGLTDSPYSMRTVAQIFYEQGYHVLCPRLPGHGTIPASLLQVSYHDWIHAVKIAAEHLTTIIGQDKPFFLAGYSNGGSLAVHYTLDSVEGSDSPMPDKVLLLSPAVGVTKYAVFANWHKTLSFLPYFEKFKWESIVLEFDPFKYNSFPKNAGDQIYLLANQVQNQIKRVASNRMHDVPPVLTFQSVVDSTVNSKDVVDKLYKHIKPNGSELVLFDVNRCAQLIGLIQKEIRTFLPALLRDDTLNYTLTIVTNKSDESLEVVERKKTPGNGFEPDNPLGMSWPIQVYSLSHVAIPFPPDDPLYGAGPPNAEALRIGSLEPRGERNLLSISAEQLLRLRHNPFHDYLQQRVHGWIADDVAPRSIKGPSI